MYISSVVELNSSDSDSPGGEDKSIEVKNSAMGSAIGWTVFSPEKKRLFLEAARRFYPNITRCCQEIGISWQTFANHRIKDKDFAKALAVVDLEVTDRIEGVMAQEAVNPKSFLDRMAYLRAHRPELYDRAKHVIVEGYKMTGEDQARRLGAVETAIDAEVTKTYLDRKQQRERRQQLKAGGGEAHGESTTGGRGSDVKP